jgi:DNA primase
MNLDEVKARIKDTPISTIIGSYLHLKKTGGNYLGLCPFHPDRNPSMHVSDSKGLFKCFSCDTGGDAITFVEKYKHLDFKEAVAEIARMLGLPTEFLHTQRPKDPKRILAERILNASQKIYRKIAEQRGQIFAKFLEQRGLTEEIARKFALGLSPELNPLTQYLESLLETDREKAFSIAEEIGLIRESNRPGQRYYDTFRKRIMFPIWDFSGQVIGQAGRAIEPGQKPKYVNSKESFIFNKRHVLYGLNFAKHSIRERDAVIIAEGQMDVITLHQHGFTNSLAVMGTGLGESSIKTLTGLSKNIIFAMDNDDAGMRAMERMNRLFLSHGVIPKSIDFTPHKDPDEFLVKSGPLALTERLENATCFIDRQIEKMIPSKIPQVTDQKLKLLDKIFEHIAPLGDSLEATERLLTAAGRLGLRSGPEQILEKYAAYVEQQSTTPRYHNQEDRQETPTIDAGPPQYDDEERLETPKAVPIGKGLRLVLKELIIHPQCLNHDKLQEILDFIEHRDIQLIIRALKEIYFEVDESEYITTVQNIILRPEVGHEIREIVGDALFLYQPGKLDQKIVTRLLSDLKTRLDIDAIELDKKRLRDKHANCPDPQEADRILVDIQQLQRRANQLNTRLNRQSPQTKRNNKS